MTFSASKHDQELSINFTLEQTPVNMDTSKVLSLLELLDDEVDDLEEALGPLLNTVLSETSSKLPLLDKAKLYVLITYAIESVLFCKDVSACVLLSL